MDIRQQLSELILKNAVNIQPDIIISDDTRLIEDLAYDSAAIIRLMVDMEDTFGIEFDDTDLLSDKINRFGDLLSIIVRLTEGTYAGDA